MGLLRLVKSVFERREGIHVCFKEMIVVIGPRSSAFFYTEPGSETILTGFAGSVSVEVEDRDFENIVRHGETFKVPGSGKIVLRSMTESVPCRIHVEYRPSGHRMH